MSDQPKDQPTLEAQILALQTVNAKIKQALNDIIAVCTPPECENEDDAPTPEVVVSAVKAIAEHATRLVIPALHPPVAWETHYQLQAAFAKVAEALKVPIRTGDDFEPIAAQCVERARAMTPHADKAQSALALVDGARDALDYVEALPKNTSDLLRAKATIDRALPLLGEMAGKEANHE